MAGPNFATNNDATYPDTGDPTAKVHQQMHDAENAVLNLFDVTTTRVDGAAMRWNASLGLWFPDPVGSVPVIGRTAAQNVPTAAECASLGYPNGCVITVDLA